MKKTSFYWRALILAIIFIILFLLVLGRLFYWQVLASAKLSELAKKQYHSQREILATRGNIFGVDNFPLATNKRAYLLYASLPHLDQSKEKIADLLAPLLIEEEEIKATVSASGKKKDKESVKKEKIKEKEEFLLETLNLRDLDWTVLQHRVSEEIKEKIESFDFKGLGFEEEPTRYYPEASMAAHLLGFVGKDETGRDMGYFGLEGFYDIELRGRPGLLIQETDAVDKPILIGSFSSEEKRDGQDLVLYLDRSVQLMVEEKLQEAVEKYKAKSGSVIILEPKTGGIISLATYPSFDPREYFKFDKSLFKNSVISDAYEPGSTFKIFVMAAALDSEAVKPETKCDLCDKPLKIDKYEIKNWDDKYHPDSDMAEIIQNSDNTGMVFVAWKLGVDDFWQYLSAFGFGQETNLDLQGETPCFLKAENQWSDVDLATAGFGQGIAVSGIQMVRAAGAIANQGKLMEPHMVKEIISGQEKISIEPKVVREVVKPETAKIIKEMMVQATEKGATKYLKKRLPGYKIAGKTGTSQIPVAGHYDEEKTIASFIGFAPVEEPKFVMLVKLREPEASPWGSETAAPLFYSIAKELFLYYGIQPD